jgi:hypothetical protein
MKNHIQNPMPATLGRALTLLKQLKGALIMALLLVPASAFSQVQLGFKAGGNLTYFVVNPGQWL